LKRVNVQLGFSPAVHYEIVYSSEFNFKSESQIQLSSFSQTAFASEIVGTANEKKTELNTLRLVYIHYIFCCSLMGSIIYFFCLFSLLWITWVSVLIRWVHFFRNYCEEGQSGTKLG